MICEVRSLKSRIQTGSVVEDVITTSNKVFKDFVPAIAVEN
jgi:hypothetical protein